MSAGGIVAVAMMLVLVAGCARGAPERTKPEPIPGLAEDRYVALASELAAHRVQIWFEVDLVKAWQAHDLDRVTGRLAQLQAAAEDEGFTITGVKVADELGYHDGIDSAAAATKFLRAARPAVRAAVPDAEVLLDMVVPELGCLGWQPGRAERSCAKQARKRFPAASLNAVTGYLRAGLVDRLDLSTGLLEDSTYTGWGTDRADAQRQAWKHVGDLGWGELTTLQSRKALARPGGYTGDASVDLAVYVDTPRELGAQAIDIWTWRQAYDGDEVSLLGPGLSPNQLWEGLDRRARAGQVLFTHMTPSAMPTSAAAFRKECAKAAEVFGAVFVAAGAG